MRIISGKYKGKKLFLPKNKNTRPLKDLVKESIFNLIKHSNKRQINILGKTFKPETNLLLGSPSILLENLIKEKKYDVFSWDPYIDPSFDEVKKKYNWDKENTLHTFFIGTKHPEFTKFKFPSNFISTNLK